MISAKITKFYRLEFLLEKLIEDEVKKVETNFETNKYEGLIYMMYWTEGNRVIPLYIGKAEKFGKNHKLSANITATDNSKFCRWGYDESRHIGGLSAAIFQDKKQKKKQEKNTINYKKWATTLFKSIHPSQLPPKRIREHV